MSAAAPREREKTGFGCISLYSIPLLCSTQTTFSFFFFFVFLMRREKKRNNRRRTERRAQPPTRIPPLRCERRFLVFSFSLPPTGWLVCSDVDVIIHKLFSFHRDGYINMHMAGSRELKWRGIIIRCSNDGQHSKELTTQYTR